MTASKAKKRTIVNVDLDEVRQVLERAKVVVTSEDYTKLVELTATYVEMTRLVREKGTTIARLRRLFGLSTNEKTAHVLGDDAAQAASEPAPNGDPSEGGALNTSGDAPPANDDAKPKKGHGRIAASDYQAEHIPVPLAGIGVGDRCACGQGNLHRRDHVPCLRIFGEPPLKARCWDLECARCATCGKLYTAAPPEEARGPKFSESAASMIATLHYGAGMPFNRADHLQRYFGVPVPASTQWEVVLGRVPALLPVFHALVGRAADGSVMHSDDTYMRILEFMGERRAKALARGELEAPERTGIFTTAIVSLTEAGLIILFRTGRKHAGENLAAVLDERDEGLGPPIHMCDGLDRNRPAGHAVIDCNCVAHGRRHIVDEAENFPAECRHVLEQMRIVFRNEAFCKARSMSDDERLRYHQEHSEPVLARMKSWIEAQFDEKRVEPNSGLGQAFNYLLKRWEPLTAFLRVSGAPIDNNICERAVKMAIRYRNASLFYKSERGAMVGDTYMTLIYTAEAHGENPFEYLTALMTHEASVAEAPDDWLPWNYRATLEMMQRAAA